MRGLTASPLRFGAVAIAVCFAVVLSAIVAIAQPQPVRVSVLIQALEGTQWQPIVEAFEEANPDIDLDIIEGPNATNLVEDLYTSSFLLGDSPYDLVYMDIVWVQKFAAAGWLLPLSDRVSETELAEFLDGDIDGSRFDGELYRMPFRSDGGMLYYRTDLLAEIGAQPPETVAELMEISKVLQAANAADWGYVWQGRQYEGLSAMFVEILEGFGGFWVNPETREVGLDQPEAIAAVQFLLNTIEEEVSPNGVTNYQEEEARRLFQNGGSVFMRNWPYAWALVNADDSPVAGKVGIKPMVHQAGYGSGACQGGWGLGIAKSSAHPDEAWRVAEFFASAAAQRQFVLESAYVPSRRALFTDPEIVAKYEHYPDLLNVVENAVLRPPIAQYAQASDILQRYLSAAFTGRQSPEEAMQQAARETRRLVDS
ncbi:MAG: ABC transporter substrate-binding protein [Elainellaceae cyanobacterium]